MATMLLISGFTRAQTIQSSNYGTTGYIKPDGTIQNSSYATVGQCTITCVNDIPKRSVSIIFNPIHIIQIMAAIHSNFWSARLFLIIKSWVLKSVCLVRDRVAMKLKSLDDLLHSVSAK